jgi:ribosomal protein S18 acetylase RimI-like enzyme
MTITNCSLDDFNQIFADIADFWGHDRTLYLHHPMYVREFGNTAYVIKDGDTVAAYLFGFLSQTRPAAYVKFVAVRPAYRRRGLARRLYDHFIAYAKTRGCAEIRAITTPTNADSIAFHRALGMELLGEPNEDGVPVLKDYAGPGRDRVVFRKPI